MKPIDLLHINTIPAINSCKLYTMEGDLNMNGNKKKVKAIFSLLKLIIRNEV